MQYVFSQANLYYWPNARYMLPRTSERCVAPYLSPSPLRVSLAFRMRYGRLRYLTDIKINADTGDTEPGHGAATRTGPRKEVMEPRCLSRSYASRHSPSLDIHRRS